MPYVISNISQLHKIKHTSLNQQFQCYLMQTSSGKQTISKWWTAQGEKTSNTDRYHNMKSLETFPKINRQDGGPKGGPNTQGGETGLHTKEGVWDNTTV